MNKNLKRLAGLGVAAAAGLGMLAVTAPSASASTVKSHGTATVSEGRKVVREADRQKCLTLKEVRKIVHGSGEQAEGGRVWFGKGKADFLFVEFNGGKCAQGAYLFYDNGDAYVWIDGRVL